MERGQNALPGAEKLLRYLKRKKLSVPKFAEVYDLDRITLQRLINGERQRVSVGTADAIQRATGGAVPWSAWVPKGDAA